MHLMMDPTGNIPTAVCATRVFPDGPATGSSSILHVYYDVYHDIIGGSESWLGNWCLPKYTGDENDIVIHFRFLSESIIDICN